MNDVRLPGANDTLMFAEAAQAADVVATQFARNEAVITALAADLRQNPPPFVVTCARGSSDHAATYAKYLFETQLGLVTASASPSVGSVYEAPLQLRGALYIVGTPKGQLRQFERELLEETDWEQVETGVEVKLASHPDGRGQEQYVLCRSQARHEKEAAMLQRQRERLRAKLVQIDAALRRQKARPAPIERRIGKWLGRNTAAEKVFRVEVLLESGWATGLRIEEDESRLEWTRRAQGAYLLRTNCREQDPRKLWH